MATLLRSSREKNLEGKKSLRESAPAMVPYRESNLRDPFFTSRVKTVKESGDPLAQRMKDMNISTSFVNECTDYDSSSGSELSTRETRPTPVTRLESLPPQVPKATELITPVTLNERQRVLELVGEMLDENLINEEEAGRAIKEAMKRDNTYELMMSLLKARKTLKSQSVFLKLWLSEAVGGSAFDGLSPILAMPVVESTRSLVISSSLRHLETMPAPSPPLMPLSLHFADAGSSESPSDNERGPTPSILLSHPRPMKSSFQRPRSIPTPSTMSPSPDLILTAMMGRSQSSGSDDCAV